MIALYKQLAEEHIAGGEQQEMTIKHLQQQVEHYRSALAEKEKTTPQFGENIRGKSEQLFLRAHEVTSQVAVDPLNKLHSPTPHNKQGTTINPFKNNSFKK